MSEVTCRIVEVRAASSGGSRTGNADPSSVRLPVEELPGILSQAANLLADAFEDYPWTRWTVDPDNRRARLRALYRLTLEDLVVPYGRLWVATSSTNGPSDDSGRSDMIPPEGVTSGQVVGAAGWLPPDLAAPPHVLERIGERTARLRGSRAAIARAADEALEHHALAAPHWYLGTLAVASRLQGRGIGSALVAAGTALADETGHPIRLETSSARNVRLYRAHGFRVVSEVALPDGAPRCWVMHRDLTRSCR